MRFRSQARVQSGSRLKPRFLIRAQPVAISQADRGIVMVLVVPIASDLLIMVVKPVMVLPILVISVLSGVLTISILVTILIVRVLSVLCQSRASCKSKHDGHTGRHQDAFYNVRHKSPSWY
jgi:hypothetical protein